MNAQGDWDTILGIYTAWAVAFHKVPSTHAQVRCILGEECSSCLGPRIQDFSSILWWNAEDVVNTLTTTVSKASCPFSQAEVSFGFFFKTLEAIVSTNKDPKASWMVRGSDHDHILLPFDRAILTVVFLIGQS
jgi:hypothetical protein